MPRGPKILPTLLISGALSVPIQRVTGHSLINILEITFGAALFVYLAYWSYIYPFYLSPLKAVPTVPGFPLWGHFFTIIRNEVSVPNREWHQKYGPIIRYFFLCGTECLSVADDEALNQICVKNPYNYPKPDRIKNWMGIVIGHGVLLAEGNFHKLQRKALLPAFSTQSIKALTPVFWREALHLTNLWQRDMDVKRIQSKSIEVLDWLNRTTLDVIGEAAFGTELNSLEYPQTPIRKAYSLCFAYHFTARLMHGLCAFVPPAIHLPTQVNRDVQEAVRIIRSKANEIVQDKHKSTHAKDKDIIALIVKDNMRVQAAGKQEVLSFETMRDQVMTFLAAGHDTTATSVTWTIHLLTKHQDVQSRLRAEIRAHYPFLFDSATRDDIPLLSSIDADRLPYLDNVCRESFRYIPTVPMTIRESVADDHLGPYFIPAKTTIYLHLNAINRLPSFWGPEAGWDASVSDPNTFDPDRWDHVPSTFKSTAHMPFLQGARGCMGRKFAETEMKSLLICLLSRFLFERDESVPDPEETKMWLLVMKPRDGVVCRVSMLDAQQ